MLLLEINEINPNELIPIKALLKQNKSNSYRYVLFGVTKSRELTRVQVSGRAATLKSYSILDSDYKLWYFYNENMVSKDYF
jgi:hypothetical protein